MGAPKVRALQLALAIMLACAFLPAMPFSQGSVQASGFVETAISKTVPIDMTFQITSSAYFQGKTAYFVTTSSDDRLVFIEEAGASAQRVYLSQNTTELEAAYAAAAQDSGGGQFNASVARGMPSLILQMNASRAEEAVCRQFTGNTKEACYTKEDCQKNCRSSPLCLGMAESSWDFFEAVAQFNTDTKNLDAEVAQDSADYAAIGQNASLQAVDNYLAHISRIIVLASNISASRLKTDYGFCPVPPFDMAKIMALRDRIWQERQASAPYMQAAADAADSAAAAARMLDASNSTGEFERPIARQPAGNARQGAASIAAWADTVKRLVGFALSIAAHGGQ